MPEPENNGYSSDYYMYKNIYNPISKKICFIDPNIVTFIGFVLTIPMVENLIYNYNMIKFILIALTKIVLDCLDGSVARKCNKQSKLGAILDIVSDTVNVCSIGTCFLYKLQYSNYKYKNYLIIIILFVMGYFIIASIDELRNKRNMNKFVLDKFCHDNMTIIYTITFTLIKKFYNVL